MRVTREALMRIVQTTVAQRVRADRSLVAIYLCGSLLEEEFLLGGATDIDLVLVHVEPAPSEREIVPLNAEIHLDIAHHLNRDYRQTRQLRVHPWMGPILNTCKVLHDPQHFLDFTQASVRGQFDRPDRTMERAWGQYDAARRAWAEFSLKPTLETPSDLLEYLRALGNAANSVASLSGAPLAERRFLLKFRGRAEDARRPGLYPGLLGLLGAPQVDAGTLESWIQPWGEAFSRIPPGQGPLRLHPGRKLYYQNAFEAILGGESPQAMLWPLLTTWSLAAEQYGVDAPERAAWRQTIEHLGLYGAAFGEKTAALDAYLDMVEETLDAWAQRNGAQSR